MIAVVKIPRIDRARARWLRRARGWLGCFPVLLLATLAGQAAELMLFDFEHGFDVSKAAATDATATLAKSPRGASLLLTTRHSQSWPGVTLVAPQDQWDLSAFSLVELSVRNVGTNRVTVNCRVDNPGADGAKNCITGSVGVEPGATKELRVPLKRATDDKLDGKLFGMRGYPVAWGGAGTVNPTNITQLVIFVNKPSADHVFEVDDIRATGSWTPPTAWSNDADSFFPLIDTFGQYRHKDWPGKVHSLAELQQRREAEAKELAAQPSPSDWDKYGGWAKGPLLKATGFFRVEKHAGKWWLVDPEGRLFWSHGIDCVRMFDSTPVEERENWFEHFPGDQPEFAEFVLPRAFALKGHYAGRSPKCYSFAGANLKRKYGADWKQAVPDVIHRRQRSWGLNTIANWSDEGVRLLRRTPYTDAISSRDTKTIEGSEGYWGKFPDVFDVSFRESLRRSMAAKKGKSAGDPWCIGYFSDNELSWGDETSLAEAALRSPPEQAAKRELLADLRAKHGDIAKLNDTWGTAHASWDALLASREAPDRNKAWTDLTAFYSKAAETYFRTVRKVIQEAAPHQLYLGCRFAWVNARAAAASAKFCDVVSYNLYRRSVADFVFNGGADVPLILGEFHFGALDRGMFHTGLVPVENQAARAAAYADYVRGALRHPQFVGTHWFQYQDQPTTGRVYDEENYQIGFVDIADTPYAETIAASRQVAAELYRLRMKQ
jgi:hypothetical protein